MQEIAQVSGVHQYLVGKRDNDARDIRAQRIHATRNAAANTALEVGVIDDAVRRVTASRGNGSRMMTRDEQYALRRCRLRGIGRNPYQRLACARVLRSVAMAAYCSRSVQATIRKPWRRTTA
jgi:hypothetical protein